MVAAVATLEPEVAANIAQAAMFECISPPGSQGTQRTSALYMRSAMPERSRISPSSTKNGMATSRKLFDVAHATSPSASVSGSREYISDSASPRKPSAAATGTASASRTIRMESAEPIIEPCLLPRCLQLADLLLEFLAHRARADRLRGGAVPVSRDQDRRMGKKRDPDQEEERQAEQPDRLRDHGGRLQGGLAARARSPGLLDHAPAVPPDEAEKRDEERKAGEVERKAQAARQQHVERIDADMGALEERRAEGPGGAERKRVARELVGAADGGVEELAQRDVDADQQRGGEHQRAPEPQAEARQAARGGNQLRRSALSGRAPCRRCRSTRRRTPCRSASPSRRAPRPRRASCAPRPRRASPARW